MGDKEKARVDRILEKLAVVREKGLSCFGSNHHEFQLNAPLDESAIAEFESEHGIQLPLDYRAFLKYAGNGGAGPYCGIYPLNKWAQLAQCWLDTLPRGFLALHCLLYPDLERRDGWEQEFDGACPYQGTISIGSQGCAYLMQLVVSGPYAGRVVYADADGSPPYMVRNTDFLEWYERWLNELLAGCDMDWFGFGLGGTEEELLAIVDDQTARARDRVEAVEGLCRLPELTITGQQSLRDLLSDSESTVRAAGCRAIRLCKVPGTEETLGILLEDDSPEVRREAVWTLMEDNASRWSDRVVARLEDDDGEVASTAFSRLSEKRCLTRPDLLRLIKESPHVRVRSGAVHAITWHREDEDLMMSLLKDEDWRVRYYAIFGLRQFKSTASIPAVIEMLNHEAGDRVIGIALKFLGEMGGTDAKDTLLRWSRAEDVFHRLEAVDGLCTLGDARVADVAREMLKEDKPPLRWNAETGSLRAEVHTVSQLVTKSLKKSPDRSLRRLVSGWWWPW